MSMSRRPVASSAMNVPDWQLLNPSIADSKLYDHLLKVSVISYRLEPRKQPAVMSHQRSASGGASNVRIQARLPKGALKALMKHFNDVAMNVTAEGLYEQVRRSCYLAFYAMVLNAKKNDRDAYEEMKLKPESLIVRFLSSVNKQLMNYPQLEPKKTTNEFSLDFVNLLLAIVKQERAGAPLISQLEDYKKQWQPVNSGVSRLDEVRGSSSHATFEIKEMLLAQHTAQIMRLSETMVQEDVLRMKQSITESSVFQEYCEYEENLRNNQHPIYTRNDFSTADSWEFWKQAELERVQELKQKLVTQDISAATAQLGISTASLIPPDPKSYFLALLRRCLEADDKLDTLLSNQSNRLLNAVAAWWRIPPETRASLVLYAAKESFLEGGSLANLEDSFVLAQNVPRINEDHASWPKVDSALAQSCNSDIRDEILVRLEGAVTSIFDKKAPKMGPMLNLLETHVALWLDPAVEQFQITRLVRIIEKSSTHEYDRLLSIVPRDSSLDLSNIHDLGHGIINIAKKLQKKYQHPLLGKIAIAKVVCAKQLKLFSVDFPPMFKHTIAAQEERGETANFETVLALYGVLTEMNDLYSQVSLVNGFPFDVEKLIYPFIIAWARDSAAISLSWVEPAIEQDNFQPLDPENSVLYSSSVNDLFTSFYASLKIIEDMHWRNQYHVAKVFTLLVEGISSALNSWGMKLFLSFCQELKPSDSVKQYQSRQERWLAIAKEAVQSGQRDVPEPYQFSTETCVKLNDIAKASELLSKMEESLNSDAISRRIEIEEKRSGRKLNTTSYLFTVSVNSATGLVPHESKATRDCYVTLVDQESRKQLGKTHVAYGTTEPRWDQKFELEMSARPRLLKLTVWDEFVGANHDLYGRTALKLDAKEFGGREYGTLNKSLDLDGAGRLKVDVSLDMQKDDIRFYFGKALRFLDRTKDDMVQMIVTRFTPFIRAVISMRTIRTLISGNRFGIETFQNWLGSKGEAKQPLTNDQIEDSLQPLFDYLNSNFATLARVLTQELKLEVISRTWEIVLETIDNILLPPLEPRKTSQAQLPSKEVEALFVWLASLKDFFHNEGAGPDMQLLQGQKYQQLMSITNYYNESTARLKEEADKIHRANIRQFNQTYDLMERSESCMFHRSRTVIQQHREKVRTAQMSEPLIEETILRILRTRGEIVFIDKHLRYRERVALKHQTDMALKGFHT